jgi:hypothetical protein
MKRRSFLKNSAIVTGTAVVAATGISSGIADTAQKSIFEWRVYHISRNPNSKKLLEQYFQDALIPFLEIRESGFAAFNAYGLEEPVKLYVLIAYPNNSAYFKVQAELFTDPVYLEASKGYNSVRCSLQQI